MPGNNIWSIIRKVLSTEEMNPYVNTTLVAVFYAIGLAILNYLRGGGFNIVESLVGGIIFWIVYFLVQQFMIKRRKGKK